MTRQELKALKELLRKFQVAAATDALPTPVEPQEINKVTEVKLMVEGLIGMLDSMEE